MIILALALAAAPPVADVPPKPKAERPAATEQRRTATRLDALERIVDALEPEVPVAVEAAPDGPTGL
ncbi:hypothetical protein [Sphingosinicella sp. BN140058]|uniref:hypothetical protein n=1 Tax=Sphingosinicella sp. BN140058 TaxID=1892855 RepID=UPI0010122207|nr:hypothetical protein [Sphingosinicella sp. BN140058]QAY77564.1 hypothetical protein ETR14_14395 [Sphingosinicella sp. BN140058]